MGKQDIKIDYKFIKVNFPPKRYDEVDILSINPLSEQITTTKKYV